MPASGDTRGGATYLGTYVWHEKWRNFGGFSALKLAADGLAFTTLSDRSTLVTGHLVRDASGVVTAVEADTHVWLRDRGGRHLVGERADSEGLAVGSDGTIWISFEGIARVRQEGRDGALPFLLPNSPDFARMRDNASLEALAVDADDVLYTIPELPFRGEDDFPVYRLRDGAWDIAFRIPQRDGFAVSDADIGPDGRFYILERDFTGLGFRSRVRRMHMDGSAEEILLTTQTGTHDNLEGLAVWNDGQSLRATMIADDNLRFFQQTEIVDYRLPD
nr:esterase-like activity of phytase family protein [Rubellimicrobium arenae]